MSVIGPFSELHLIAESNYTGDGDDDDDGDDDGMARPAAVLVIPQ